MSVASLRARFYPAHDRQLLNSIVLARVQPSWRVLEIGCGYGRNSPQLKGRVALYAGIDPDPRICDHPELNVGVRCGAERLPWPDQFFDLVFHSMVAEHLLDPSAVMRETARVLRPGGTLLFETPNRWHYVSLAAAVTPHWFHGFWIRRLGGPRQAGDVFETLYRCNDRRQIARALRDAGLCGKIRHIARPPNYLSFHPAAFMVEIIYERTVESLFPRLRARLLVEARKPVSNTDHPRSGPRPPW